MDAFLSSTPCVLALLGLGIVLIIRGGDLFVTSSVAIAHHLRIPNVVIGSTLVSLATTAPELAVSATASFQGQPGIAIGNAVGSAIANIGLILGLLCILHPIPVRPRDFVVPGAVMLGMGLLMIGLTWRLRLGRSAGAVLLACGVAYLVTDYLRHRPGEGSQLARVEVLEHGAIMSLRRALVMFLVGAVLVIGGGQLLSRNAATLALRVGVPPIIIGLTLVAFGTSLPELVTAITAARKGVPELSLGNVVGANILNLTLVTGSAASIAPLTLTRWTQGYNLLAMVVIFILLIVLGRLGKRLSRRDGCYLLGFYALYLTILFVHRG
jgi:cation:H+ antiporter